MKQFGMTTIAHWMAVRFPKGVKAYMESRGQLFRLKRIRSYNGKIRPILATLADMKLNGEFTSVEKDRSLSSAVYLSTGADLAGTALVDILDAVEPARLDCWAMRPTLDPPVTRSQSARSRGVTAIGENTESYTPCWYG